LGHHDDEDVLQPVPEESLASYHIDDNEGTDDDLITWDSIHPNLIKPRPAPTPYKPVAVPQLLLSSPLTQYSDFLHDLITDGASLSPPARASRMT
jgi:hypothetical protein